MRFMRPGYLPKGEGEVMSDNTEGLARRLIRECDWNMDKARAALEHALETVRYEYCQRCLKHTRCWEGLPALSV